MTVPTSRYLTRLDDAIALAGESVDGDCLRAERVIYLARQGRSDEARVLLSNVKASRDRRINLSVSAWVNLADGLLEYFADATFAPRSKLLRAQALAASGKLLEVEALASAWLAQLDFSDYKIETMTDNLRRALRIAPGYRPARARACLVAAQGLHFAYGFAVAAPWFTKARLEGVDLGDELTINAVVHNMAWHRLYGFRQHVLRTGGEPSQDEFVALSGESYRNYDTFLGVSAFDQMEPMFTAEYFALTGRASEALAVWRDSLTQIASGAKDRWHSHMLACYGWCKALVGDKQGACATAAEAQAAINDNVQVDDLAATYSYLARLFTLTEDASDAHDMQAAADTTWARVEALHARLGEALTSLPA